MALLGQSGERWLFIEPLGHVEFRKQKHERKSKAKWKQKWKFILVFHFRFCFHFRVCFSFHFRFFRFFCFFRFYINFKKSFTMAPLGHQNSILFINKRLFQQTNATNETKIVRIKVSKIEIYSNTKKSNNNVTAGSLEKFDIFLFLQDERLSKGSS